MMVDVVVIDVDVPIVGAGKTDPIVTAEVVKLIVLEAADIPLLLTD